MLRRALAQLSRNGRKLGTGIAVTRISAPLVDIGWPMQIATFSNQAILPITQAMQRSSFNGSMWA